jgi:hypothetical protein
MSDFNAEKNRFVWIDIPVADLDRASTFYREVTGAGVHHQSYEGEKFGVLEHDDGNGACLILDPDKINESHGPLVYLNVDGRIGDAVAKVAAHGGRILRDVHAIGPFGLRALIIDSEGNRLALHSRSRA